MKIALVKSGLSYKAADEDAAKALARVKDGEVFLVDFVRHRNVKHHRKLFALLKIAADNSDDYNGNVERLLDDVKEYTGRFDAKIVPVKNTRFRRVVARLAPVLEKVGLPMPAFFVIIRPHSIAFESMDQNEFEPFYQEALDYVCAQVLPGVNREDLEMEILSSF